MGPLKGGETKKEKQRRVTAVVSDEDTQWPWALYV